MYWLWAVVGGGGGCGRRGGGKRTRKNCLDSFAKASGLLNLTFLYRKNREGVGNIPDEGVTKDTPLGRGVLREVFLPPLCHPPRASSEYFPESLRFRSHKWETDFYPVRVLARIVFAL